LTNIPQMTGERLFGFRTVVFDFDGTLCDSAGDIKKTFIDSAIACGYDASTLCEIPIGPSLAHVLRVGLGREIDDAAMNTLLAKYRKLYLSSNYSLSPLYPGVLELLQQLKASGKFIAMATNKGKRGTLRMIELKKITHLFDHVFCYDLGGEFWSKERMLHTILTETQTAPENAVFFGDATTDIAAGRNVDVPTVAALYGYGNIDELMAAGPDFVCSNIADLMLSPENKQPV